MHWHAYAWTGFGPEREDDSVRRPSDEPVANAAFAASPVPPHRTCDWLLKPASLIKQTFHDPDLAVRWLGDQWDAFAPALLHPYDHKAGRLAGAAQALRAGVDVQWGDWLRGERFVSVGVICCPNRDAPQYRCPVGIVQP
jgi:hypothetical protein